MNQFQQLNYFFDENFSHFLANAIAQLHRNDFPDDRVTSARGMNLEGAADQTWVGVLEASGESWVVLTHDRMRKEWRTVQTSGVTWFIFERGWSSLRFWDEAWKLVKAWPEIIEASQRSRERAFNVAVSGRVRPAR